MRVPKAPKMLTGPKHGWGAWRAARDRKLAKPRRCKAAQALANRRTGGPEQS